MALKKRLLVVFLLGLLLTACSNVNTKKVENLPDSIISLKNALEISPNDAELRQKLGVELHNYYLKKAVEKNVAEENLPFLLHSKNNSVGCLLVHGFTATPWELRELGNYLYKNNISVYGALIDGHGTTPEELDKTRWQDWYKSAEEGLLLMSYLTERTYICGQSAGASLAITLAESNNVAGIVLIAAPIYLNDIRAKFAFLLAPFNYYNKNTNLKEDDKNHYYEMRSARSIAELVKLIDDNKKNMNKVSAPVLIIQSIDDTRIKPESAKYIYDNIGSDEKKIITIDKPEHVLTTGDQNNEVFESIIGFIKENERIN